MLQSVRYRFQHPSSDCQPAPLWVWNDRMTAAVIRAELAELKQRGFGGAFIHPRPGLVTEYLSEEWFALWSVALEEARTLGMKLYIYDENSYPSGFAGGHVPSSLPDCLAAAVVFKKIRMDEIHELNVVASPMLNRPGRPIRVFAGLHYMADCIDHYAAMTDVTHVPIEKWPDYGNVLLVFELGFPETNAWLGGFAYPDLLRPEVADLFLRTTYESYRARFGEHFGSDIPAIFTDEPEISPGNLFQEGSSFLPFSFWFSSRFEERNGYDLKDCLPCLFLDVQMHSERDACAVRYDYYETLHELWTRNFIEPVSQWCQQHQIAYTGHYLEHNWPYPWGRTSPAVMSAYEYMDWPAIDMLMTHLLKKDGTDPLHMLTIREAQSAANQLGKARVLCESFGAGGWDSTFEDYKRIGDWLMVHGINFMNYHLTFSTIAGARKRDHPQSFDWRQPWWQELKDLNRYFSRMSSVLSAGVTSNRILVLNPNTAAYMLRPADEYEGTACGKHFAREKSGFLQMLQMLSDRQWDFDLGDPYIMERHARVEGGKLEIGKARYEAIVIHSMNWQIRSSTFLLLHRYLEQGGKIYCIGSFQGRIDGREDSRIRLLTDHPGWDTLKDVRNLLDAIGGTMTQLIEIKGPLELPPGVGSLKRTMNDGSSFYFLVNSSTSSLSLQVSCGGQHIELWDPWTGRMQSIPADHGHGIVSTQMILPGSGSALLYVADTPLPSVVQSKETNIPTYGKDCWNIHETDTPLTIKPDDNNVLVLDYCNLKAGSKSYEGISALYASRLVFEHHGFENNPWDNAIQFKRRWLERNERFPPSSGFQVSYQFAISANVDIGALALDICLERPELYIVEVNGTPVVENWVRSPLDRHIGEVNICNYTRHGDNLITVTGRPFSLFMEIESLLVRGNFTLAVEHDRFVVHNRRELFLGAWSAQGYPFYSQAVNYSREIILDEKCPTKVRLGLWRGSIASVRVNQSCAGLIGTDASSDLDITEFVRKGRNEITVRVCGTFKNIMGPHHDESKPRNTAWPGNWKKGPMIGVPKASEYDVIEYGLFEDFKILKGNCIAG